jgi:hypothetical protein
MGDLAEPGMRAGAVDDDEIRAGFERRDRGREPSVVEVFAGLELVLGDLGQVAVIGDRQVQMFLQREGRPVFQIAGEGLLSVPSSAITMYGSPSNRRNGRAFRARALISRW